MRSYFVIKRYVNHYYVKNLYLLSPTILLLWDTELLWLTYLYVTCYCEIHKSLQCDFFFFNAHGSNDLYFSKLFLRKYFILFQDYFYFYFEYKLFMCLIKIAMTPSLYVIQQT